MASIFHTVLSNLSHVLSSWTVWAVIALLIVGQLGRAINQSQSHDGNAGVNAWAYLVLRPKYPRLYRWIDNRVSCNNKWRKGDPANGETFWGSSNLLVFITDLWHFSYFIEDNVYDLALVLLIRQAFDVDIITAWMILQPAAFVFELIYRPLRKYKPPVQNS